jgi:putative nucleotidyltransferase with HDIG domain
VRSNPPPSNPKNPAADKSKLAADKTKVDKAKVAEKGKALMNELRAVTRETPGYGAGNYTLDLDEYELAGSSDLQLKLLSIFRSPQYKPPVLPNIALELTDLSKKQNVSYDDVVRVVEKDPMITASVLKLAQSPLYGGRPVQSLKDALNRLGIATLRDLVWQVVANMRLFRVRNYAPIMERMQLHATFTAYAARIIAQKAGIAAEHAFLCGLLHDIGWSGTLLAISENNSKPPEPKTLFAAIDKMHVEAGAAMAKLWGLSQEICTVIGHHHHVDRQRKPASVLVPVLCVAEHLADELGFGIEIKPEDGILRRDRIDANLDGRFETAVGMLKLENKLDAIREAAAEAGQRIRKVET